MGALELHGYMKVADNTYPNVAAFLTGMHEEDDENCESSTPDTFDNCPYIWKEFTKKGFVTHMSEDQPQMGTFTLDRPGFEQKPVDHYLRPLMQEAFDNSNGFCVGRRSQISIVTDYLADFISHYRNDSFFAFAWSSSVSHESINTLQMVDQDLQKLFQKKFFETGISNNTIIFFLSDHGSRLEDIRRTFIGTGLNFGFGISKLADQKTNDSEEKLKRTFKKKSKYNVVIFGIDATSRLNKIRSLQLTSKYIEKEMGALELHGYMKVADNTYPNLAAMLTGMHEQDDRKCISSNPDSFDNCPYIWKEFTKKGFVTLFAEDQPHIGAFTLDRPGFEQKPVDHYLRPLMQEAFDNRKGFCVGRRPEISIVTDYLSDFIYHYRNDSFFALTWSSSISHESINTLQMVDQDLQKFFQKKFVETGISNNTIIFFLSDHGSRVEDIRRTFVGRYEDSLPFMYGIFPKSFRAEYPHLVENFKINSNRFTTAFDIYETMIHILNIDNPQLRQKSKSGISLFDRVPVTRTCTDARVPALYCVCEGTHRNLVSVDYHKNVAAQFLVRYINEKLMEKSNNCEKLTLDKIESFEDDTEVEAPVGKVVIRLQISVLPSNAKFEAVVTVYYRPDDLKIISKCEINGNNINRINRYGHQSWCIHDTILKKYCLCKKNI
ncbi:hypothetical protein GQR58_024076 [Nymphon striatum]|nr:hypothetical protein GQR58_024076 [Nymphon striatum]